MTAIRKVLLLLLTAILVLGILFSSLGAISSQAPQLKIQDLRSSEEPGENLGEEPVDIASYTAPLAGFIPSFDTVTVSYDDFRLTKIGDAAYADLGEDAELFETLYDAVEHCLTEVDCGASKYPPEKFAEINGILEGCREFSQFFKYADIQNNGAWVSGDMVTITYEKGVSLSSAKQSTDAFHAAADAVVSDAAGEECTDFYASIAIYTTLAAGATLSESGDSGAYGALVDRHSDSKGYAELYAYLLNRLGIECHIVVSDGRYWNILLLGGNYYHADIAGEIAASQGYGLNCFGLSDLMRLESSLYTVWSCVAPGGKSYVAPACDTPTLAVLSQSRYASLYTGRETALYIDEADGYIYRLSLEDFSVELHADIRAGAFAVYNNYLYFADEDDHGTLYKAFVDGAGASAEDGSMSVKGIAARDGDLYYTDYNRTEKITS